MNLFIRRLFTTILILALVYPDAAFARRHRRHARGYVFPSAVSAYLWDSTANRPYYAKNIDRRVFPASTTKVMTVILALEHLSLDQYVTVRQNYTQIPQTKLSLRMGEQYKVRDLLYAALLKSANDAAMVLGDAVAGSQSQFVVMMNQRAAELGAHDTHFANPHGLPSVGAQYTTARDMALIMQEALKKPFFLQAIATKYRIIYSKSGRRFFLKSHNHSLFLNWKTDIDGKTGYTRQAQSCFLGYFRKNGDIYIVSLYGSRKRWQDIKIMVERYGGVNL